MSKANELAFPSYFDNGDESYANGLTKREWFAGMAMQGIVSNSRFDETVPASKLAQHAFMVADAMLAEDDKS
jgi:hypothetical protein